MSAAPASAMGGPAPSGPRLTRAEFARRADANCRRLGRAAAGLGNPKTLPGVTRQLDALMPMFWQAYGRQGLLAPPAGEEPATVQWMNAMAAVGSDLENTQRAASRGDAGGVRAAQTRAAEHDKRVAQLSAQLGMQICS